MITEDYVSFETAKLLKEKGFDAEGVSEFGGYYVDYEHNEQNVGIATESMMLNKNLEDWEYLRPTLQMAIKWLREVHKLFIAINMIPDTIQKPYFFKLYVDKKIYNFPLDYSVEFYTTYEEACEVAIKYCLENLI
jgi:hypothetical protein